MPMSGRPARRLTTGDLVTGALACHCHSVPSLWKVARTSDRNRLVVEGASPTPGEVRTNSSIIRWRQQQVPAGRG